MWSIIIIYFHICHRQVVLVVQPLLLLLLSSSCSLLLLFSLSLTHPNLRSVLFVLYSYYCMYYFYYSGRCKWIKKIIIGCCGVFWLCLVFFVSGGSRWGLLQIKTLAQQWDNGSSLLSPIFLFFVSMCFQDTKMKMSGGSSSSGG